MNQKSEVESTRDMDILNLIEIDPNATQASIADRLGLAVGTVNWHLKRLISKGFVKIQRCERRKLKYIITPEGLAMRARLTVDYIHSSLGLYRLIRARMRTVLSEPEMLNTSVRLLYLDGQGDVEEICRLTCMEQGWKCVAEPLLGIPQVHIVGLKLFLELPENLSDIVSEDPSEPTAVSGDALRSCSAI